MADGVQSPPQRTRASKHGPPPPAASHGQGRRGSILKVPDSVLNRRRSSVLSASG
ncbi:hypothetical protein BaRGS_00014000, partial [Batillaria attramentaria]